VADALHLNLTNAFLPLTVLLVVAVVLPAVLAGQTLSQGRLAVAIAVTGVVVLATGAAIMALLYARLNGGQFPGVWPSLERSSLMALLWGPVLALVWLMRAQGIERRRGLRMGQP
jgi:hypothetical protein